MATICCAFLKQHPHLLHNYLRYRCYHDHFPNHDTLTVWQTFYVLIADFFYIKSLLSLRALEENNIALEDFINVIYGFHALSKARPDMERKLVDFIEKTKLGDYLSALQLLR